VLCAAVSAYYYFKIIQAMFFKENTQLAPEGGAVMLVGEPVSRSFKGLLILTAALLILLGLFPSLLTDWLHYMNG
jgi:NADH-quinone oxidoreductase subunit N